MSCTPKFTLSINKPTAADIARCKSNDMATVINGSGCSAGGPLECCDRAVLGPRKNRDNVRQKLHDYILLKLGGPVIELELDEQQIDLAIDEAMLIWEMYAPREYYQYYTFPATPGKSVYQLPPEIGYIRDVYYKETAQYAFQATDLDGVLPVEYFYPGGTYSGMIGGLAGQSTPLFGQLGAYTLAQQYNNMYSRISSQIGGWEYVGGLNTIKIYPTPCRANTHVMVHYIQKCKDLLCLPASLLDGCLAFAMQMLGEIRSKFSSIPSPNGGVILNGQDILQRGIQKEEKWREDLISRYGDCLGIFLG